MVSDFFKEENRGQVIYRAAVCVVVIVKFSYFVLKSVKQLGAKCIFVFSGWIHQSIDQYCSCLTFSQAHPSRPLPDVLSHQPLLHPRLQRSPRCLLQSQFPQQQQPGSCCSRCSCCSYSCISCRSWCSCNTREWAPATRDRLQPEQPHQTPRLQKHRLTRQQHSGQHVSKTQLHHRVVDCRWYCSSLDYS